MLCSCPFYNMALLLGVKTFDSYIEPLSKLQKRAVRAISHQPFLVHSLPIFKDLKLLRVVDIFKLRLLSFVYESVNMVAPDCFHNFFFLNSTVHCHNTRQSTRGDLFLANINTSKFTFKKSLKLHFLNAM